MMITLTAIKEEIIAQGAGSTIRHITGWICTRGVRRRLFLTPLVVRSVALTRRGTGFPKPRRLRVFLAVFGPHYCYKEVYK